MLCDFYNEALEYQENLLVKYYRKHGHEVTVIASTFESVFDYYNDRHDNRTPPRTYFHEGAKIIKLRYRFNLLNKLRAYTSIYGILEEAKPELIFVHDIMPNMLEAVRYKQRHSECRIIMDYHADYSNSGKNWLSLAILHGVVRKWLLDRARPHLSRIFPIVPAGTTFLHEIYKVPHSEMEVLPLGADTDLGRVVRENKEGAALRRTLRIPDGDIVIFSGGKLAPAKQTEVLIDAIMRLGNPAIHVIVAGDASREDEQYKQRLLGMSEATPTIHFVGWLDRRSIYVYLDMADLAVFPASQSILWQQAISMGLPLVVGDTGHQDISYLNTHDNIVILDKDEIHGARLAGLIQTLVSEPERLRRMREGAMTVADELLNWDKLILRTLRFSDEVNANAG